MVIYIIELLMTMFFALFGDASKNKKIRGAVFALLFFSMTLIMAIREPHLGTDSWLYSELYLRIGKAPNLIKAIKVSGVSAPMYVLMCRIVYKIFQSRQALLIVSAILVNGCFYNFIKRESKNWFFSLFLFMSLTFHFQSYNTTRQYIALGLAMNGVSYIGENVKSVKGWILLICGVLNHTVAIISLVYLVLGLRKRDQNEMAPNELFKTVARGVIITFIFVFGQTLIMTLLPKVFPQYYSYFDMTSARTLFDQGGQGRQIFIFIGYLIAVIYGLLQLKTSDLNESIHGVGRKYIVQLSAMIIAVGIGIVGAKSWALTRIGLFFTINAINFFPNTFMLSKRYRQINKFAMILTILFTFIYAYIYLAENKAGIIPYTTFF